MKTKTLGALTVVLAVSAASLITALPASATATVGTDVASFLSSDISNSVVSHDGATIAYSGFAGHDVWLLDTATNVATEITNPDIYEPGLGSFSPDNATLYVPEYSTWTDAVVVVDVATATVTKTLISSYFDGPWTSVVSPDGNTLYVASYYNGTIVTYNLADDTSQAVTSVNNPAYLAITPDGSTIYIMDESGAIDVFDTATGTITGTFTGPDILSYSACTNPDVTVMYIPSSLDDTLYAVSLADGSTIASKQVQPSTRNGDNYSCAVSPDDSKVFVTNIGIGAVDTVDASVVTTPGVITEFNADTLRLGATIGFSGVAFTQMMNFYDNCSAYVAGLHGNAQRFTFDDTCVVGDPASQSGAAPEAALAQTGVNGAAISGLAGGGALAALLGITIVAALRRRRAQK